MSGGVDHGVSNGEWRRGQHPLQRQERLASVATIV